ncbi:MAG: peptidylprolyl isomerase [Bacteroidales bacterium]|jgi:FKBP-type peptidyl-prolyl cis-trans isomerase|nr:peptidylprolyl isomerase [Bacteroidales bacterium]
MLIIILILAVALTSFSCRSETGNYNNIQVPGKKELADMNRYLIQKDRERIENYIERRGLPMKESPSGLWYYIENEGYGTLLADNDRVLMEYNCFLIDGTRCYSSQELGPKELIIGRSETQPGLNQALRMLKPGGEGIFIMPPFLGFGLKGDGNRIPSRATIVYEIKIPAEK